MNRLIDQINSPAAIAIADKIRALELSGEKIFKLQTGEPCFETPDYIKQALQRPLGSNQTKYSYSQGIPELRIELASAINSRYGVALNEKQFFITNGAVSAIQYAIQSIIEHGDEVLIFDPSWPQYSNITSLYGGIPKRISTKTTNFFPTLKLVKANITAKTKLIIFNNPNNPTGIIIPEKEFEEVLNFLVTQDIYLLFDEVYDSIVYDHFHSIFQSSFYNELKEKIVYINSFSKTFCMTGWRLGYAIVPNKIAGNYLKLIQNSITNVATFIQWASLVALKEKENHLPLFAEMVATYEKRKNELVTIFNQKKWKFVNPNGSFYFFIEIPEDNPDFVNDLLDKHKIAVVPGIAYGSDFNNYFRISFAVDNYSYNGFINWLKNG
jgi:aspartate/methionine/tyrosine aminotransferase